MKRILLLLLAVTLAAPAVLAETTVLSPALEAEKLAIAAMYDQYGFTLETLGLFTIRATEKEDAWYVTFQTEFLPYSRIGQYDAVVQDGRVSLRWSHRDSEHPLVDSGDLSSPCWGVRQMEAYLSVPVGKRADWVEPYFAEDEKYHAIYDSAWDALGLSYVDVESVDMTGEVWPAAEAALREVYAMTEEQFAAMKRLDNTAAGRTPEGQLYVRLTFSQSELCFHVLVEADSLTAADISLLSGGNG